jgi:hypothetical protein
MSSTLSSWRLAERGEGETIVRQLPDGIPPARFNLSLGSCEHFSLLVGKKGAADGNLIDLFSNFSPPPTTFFGLNQQKVYA